MAADTHLYPHCYVRIFGYMFRLSRAQ